MDTVSTFSFFLFTECLQININTSLIKRILLVINFLYYQILRLHRDTLITLLDVFLKTKCYKKLIFSFRNILITRLTRTTSGKKKNQENHCTVPMMKKKKKKKIQMTTSMTWTMILWYLMGMSIKIFLKLFFIYFVLISIT